MPPPGGKKTPFDQGVVAKLSGALSGAVSGLVSGAIRGASEAWFGPLQPIAPQAPQDPAAGAKGRAFDYPFGWNISWTPRGEAGQGGITFQELRDLSDPTRGGLDLLRLAIETRKDQMASQPWAIKARDGKETDASESRAKQITDALEYPDGEHDFHTWQRMLLEDLLVLDAPCLYLAPVAGGKRPEVMDGALIKRLMRPDGRRPEPPDPAYQQKLKGLAAVDYTSDELIYMPRNPRPNRVYGLGPVEQTIMTVDMALRRQLSQREYFTDGSVPDVVMGTPESWSAEQVRQFQEYWDALLTGNTAERRHARFIPGGIKPFELKPGQLKDGWDEWLARIICYAFSLSPQALIQQMNRATAETAHETAIEEGLEPLKLYWRSFMARVLRGCWPDGAAFEFVFEDEEVIDAKTKADVSQKALGNKAWLTLDEVREIYGKPPATPEQIEELRPPPPPALDPGNGDEPPGVKDKDDEEKGDGDKKEEVDDGVQHVRRARARRSLPRDQSKPPGRQPVCGQHPRRYP
jgi:hypothetical protein